jgi:transcription initiation factor IIE alpha subunit
MMEEFKCPLCDDTMVYRDPDVWWIDEYYECEECGTYATQELLDYIQQLKRILLQRGE